LRCVRLNWNNRRKNVLYRLICPQRWIVNSRFCIILISSKTVFEILRTNSNIKEIIRYTRPCVWFCRCLIKNNIVLCQEWRTQNNRGVGRSILNILSYTKVAPLMRRSIIIFKYVRIIENVLQFKWESKSASCCGIINIDVKL